MHVWLTSQTASYRHFLPSLHVKSLAVSPTCTVSRILHLITTKGDTQWLAAKMLGYISIGQ